jgi:hypothetical protein
MIVSCWRLGTTSLPDALRISPETICTVVCIHDA